MDLESDVDLDPKFSVHGCLILLIASLRFINIHCLAPKVLCGDMNSPSLVNSALVATDDAAAVSILYSQHCDCVYCDL